MHYFTINNKALGTAKLQSLIQYRIALRTTADHTVSYRTENAREIRGTFKVKIFSSSI